MTGPPLATPAPWDLAAAGYADVVAPVFGRFVDEALRLAAPPPGARVLDVAAGPGTLALVAARDAARVDAVDFAPEMIARLDARARAEGLAHVHAQVADGQALPFADGTFDAAFSIMGVIFFPDLARGLAEMARVVKSGGAVVVSSWPPATGVARALFRAIAEVTGSEGPGELPLGDAPAYARALGAAGLSAVHVVEVAHAVRVDGVDALMDGQERGFPPLVWLARRAGEGWPALRARLRERVRAALGDGPLVMELPALLGIGRKP